MNKLKWFVAVFAFIFISSCEKDGPEDNYENLEFFYSNASALKVDVAYEPGAEPYVSGGFGSNNNFEFSLNNLNNLFAGRTNPIAVSVDMQLSDMTQIPAKGKSSFTQS